MEKLKIFEKLGKIEDISNFGKIKDFSNFGKNWWFLKNFHILAKNDEFHVKKLKEVSMLGFEHPSHMVTHPSTDEAQCCLTLEMTYLANLNPITFKLGAISRRDDP